MPMFGNMFNRPQVPMNRPMTPMNRVSSAPAATPGIAALLNGQPMQQSPVSAMPMRQDVSSMGLGSLPQAGQPPTQSALNGVMAGMQQGQGIPDWAMNYIAQPGQAMQQAQLNPQMAQQMAQQQLDNLRSQQTPKTEQDWIGRLATTYYSPGTDLEKVKADFLAQKPPQLPQLGGQLGAAGPAPAYNPMQTATPMGPMVNSPFGQTPQFPMGGMPYDSTSTTTQQDMMGGNRGAPQTNMASNLAQMFNKLGQQPAQQSTQLDKMGNPMPPQASYAPGNAVLFNSMGQQQSAQQGGTPLQNGASPLQQSAKPMMNMGVM